MLAKLAIAILVAVTPLAAQFDGMLANKPILDAHNCYPYEGKWSNRIDRALSTGSPVSIEQDIALYQGRAVVSHTAKTTGVEPLFPGYFFARVRPIVEKALKENKPDTWPVIILHFDFKDTQAPLLHAVWDVLGQYQDWITTAPKTADPHSLNRSTASRRSSSPKIPTPRSKSSSTNSSQAIASASSAPPTPLHVRDRQPPCSPPRRPSQLLREKPTNYRRWWNNSWDEVEEGGQPAPANGPPPPMPACVRSSITRTSKVSGSASTRSMASTRPRPGWDASVQLPFARRRRGTLARRPQRRSQLHRHRSV